MWVFEQLKATRGQPEVLRGDNGLEFLGRIFVAWCQANGVLIKYIQPGKPTQNAFIERFNRGLRHEVRDLYLFRGRRTHFDLLRKEDNAAVRAVLGHFTFVYIHPYMDGNGRIGRFLMNAMLVSGGYPWTVVPLERRNDYMTALEQASTNQNITPFAKFLAGLVRVSMEGESPPEIP